jgi:hypothetical protein
MGSTHTQAGLLALAGAARPRVASAPASACTSAAAASYGTPQHQVTGHPSATWTKGAIAGSATFMVLNGKNRPTRPLSELSP